MFFQYWYLQAEWSWKLAYQLLNSLLTFSFSNIVLFINFEIYKLAIHILLKFIKSTVPKRLYIK